MNLTRSQRLAYGTIAALAAVLLLVLLYLQLGGRVRTSPADTKPVSVGGLSAAVAAKPFDIQILSDERYRRLDRSLLGARRVPVPVPAVRGKPNLF